MKSDLFTCRAGGLEFSRFSGLDSPSLIHAIFNRRGGASLPPYDSLNVSYWVEDDAAAVRQNRALIKRALALQTLVSARQVHGKEVLVVAEEPAADFEAKGYDALITNRLGHGLMIQQADCQAVLIHDPVTPALGLAHVGWRGNVAGIVGATVRAMTTNYGSTPCHLKAAISPALGPCCGQFIGYRQQLPSWMHSHQVRPDFFDFPAITMQQLQEAGLSQANIFTAGICTRCSPDYFSYRRSGKTGRFATVAALPERGA